MIKRAICIFCVIIFVCCFSCSKDSNKPDSKPSAALLTAHGWKIQSVFYRLKTDNANSDFTQALYHPCELDDVYKFFADSTFERSDNAITCDESVSLFGPWGQGNWQPDSSFSSIDVSGGGLFAFNYHFTIDALTDKSFIAEWETKDYLNNDVVYTFEFVPE